MERYRLRFPARYLDQLTAVFGPRMTLLVGPYERADGGWEILIETDDADLDTLRRVYEGVNIDTDFN